MRKNDKLLSITRGIIRDIYFNGAVEFEFIQGVAKRKNKGQTFTAMYYNGREINRLYGEYNNPIELLMSQIVIRLDRDILKTYHPNNIYGLAFDERGEPYINNATSLTMEHLEVIAKVQGYQVYYTGDNFVCLRALMG